MTLTQAIIEAIKNKKGHDIMSIDMRKLAIRPCDWFVIAEGNSNTQVHAIADEVEDFVRKEAGEKPAKVIGHDNAQWIAMDYGNVMVHIFQHDTRHFYDIESLWADGEITNIPEEN